MVGRVNVQSCKRVTVEEFADKLKILVDDMADDCKKDDVFNSLVYAKDNYGIMQREMLKEIFVLIGNLKKCVDCLLEECQDIHEDMR